MTGVSPKIHQTLRQVLQRVLNPSALKTISSPPPELLDGRPAIQQTNVDLSVAPAALGGEEVVAQPPSATVVGKESTAQPPWIDPQPPPIGGPSPTANMPTLLRLAESGKTPAESRRYPERNNRSPFLTPPRVINASSLGKGHDMTPLDVRSPAGATLEQVLYAETKNFGDDNDSHKLSNFTRARSHAFHLFSFFGVKTFFSNFQGFFYSFVW